MDFKEILGDAHTEEIEKALLKAVGKEFIPKAKFDEANEAKKTAESLIAERDKQIADLSKVDATALQTKIAELTAANTEAATKYQEDLQKVKLNALIENKLLASGAVNTKAVKALLDAEKITLDGENVKGLDEQITSLQEAEKWAFGASTVTTGMEHGTGTSKEKTLDDALHDALYPKEN